MRVDKITILVIDDDPGYQFLVPRLLEPLGTKFKVAGTLAEGMGILGTTPPPDFIFLDLRLPDSPEAILTLQSIPKMRELAPKAPLVVLTGDPDEKLAQIAKTTGADAYRTKKELDAQKYLYESMRDAIKAQVAKGIEPAEAARKLLNRVRELLEPHPA